MSRNKSIRSAFAVVFALSLSLGLQQAPSSTTETQVMTQTDECYTFYWGYFCT
jgi:hypothetical protein